MADEYNIFKGEGGACEKAEKTGEAARTHEVLLREITTGAQKVERPLPTFISARASWPIWRPVSCQSVRLKDIPVVIGKANLVVGTGADTPELDSDHQL